MPQKLPNLDLHHQIYLSRFPIIPINLLYASLFPFLYLSKLFENLKSSVFFDLCKLLISIFFLNSQPPPIQNKLKLILNFFL
jgi:hypothetical protein